MNRKTMQILNIAGYKFIALSNLELLRDELRKTCDQCTVKGTILLSREGINISLAGTVENIRSLQAALKENIHFCDMRFHESYSNTVPFQFLKVRVKKEIITMNVTTIDPVAERAPNISPTDFKKWLDENRDITLLDTRNDYEISFGTFSGAMNLQLNHFGEFPAAIENIDRDKPIVMFCTGGIRCEKAALHMLGQGFTNVFQLDGGILGYFKQVGGAHFNGDCFIFDERRAVDENLNHAPTDQCPHCLETVPVKKSCPTCKVPLTV
jgi:UPF0176 protein